MHLNRSVSGNRKTIVIIDEINRLLENFDSKAHDTDAISSALWMFLDRQRRNPHFFLIGTMNRDDKMPDPLKSRIGGARIEFPPLTDEKKLEIFKNILTNGGMQLDDECHDVFMEASMKSLGEDTSPRDYENVQMKISRLICVENKKRKNKSKTNTITTRHIKKGIQYVRESYDKSKYMSLQLTEEEWRDFNAVQNKIIDIQLQCAQKIPISVGASLLGPNASISRAPGLDLEEAIEILEKELSPEQKSLYRRVMKKKDTDPLIDRGIIDSLRHKFQTTATGILDKGGSEALKWYKPMMKLMEPFLEKGIQLYIKNTNSSVNAIDNK